MTHQRDVQACAHLFARNLGLDDAAVTAVGLAALWHDEGKRDPRFQAMLHGGDRIAAAVADSPLAKSGFSPLDRHAFRRARERAGYPRGMRHEALSAQIAAHFLAGRDDVDHDLVLHLIASHHGRSRPLLPPAADPAPVTAIGAPEWAGELPVDTGRPVEWSAPARFARLNARYGRWGLARMEAVVRLADIWCSARGKPPGPPAGQAAPVTGLPARLAQEVPDGVELPALDGRDPLGFLAALGLVRILTETAGVPARLAFSPDSGCAVLWSELTTTGEISEILTRVVKEIPPGAVLPLAGPGFPPPSGTGKDPLRPSRSGYRTMTASFNETDLEVISAWLPCLVTDLAADRQGRAALTPFTAPSGQQKVRTFFEKPLRAVAAAPRSLYEALTGWRRIDGFTGEYLDHRVLRSAADDVEGRPGQEAGVPGATWLATMALPLLSHTGDGTRPRTVLWYRNEGSDMMMWPLWREPLDPHAIKCLLDHPALQQAAKPGNSQNLAPLGVFAVCGAERQRIPGRNFDGVLTPITALIR
jgi:CRISPR-associated endonuclease/helicase Cas3